MSLPRYPEYKDSGVEWLGELPRHWSVCRYKEIFSERDERSVDGAEQLLSVSAYTGVTPRAEGLADGEFLSRAESLEGYRVCYPDDLVINIMLAWNRGLGVSKHHGIVSPAYSVFRVIGAEDPRYLDYMVRSDRSILYYKAFSAGVIDSRLRLYPDTFASLYCGLPPLGEQRLIANFLDRETARIDALIAEQEKLLALLAEKRQATISHAVTRGLDPNVPMKDSGIAWLGEVPAHWEVGPLKHWVVFKSGGTPSKDRVDYWGGDIPWASAKDLKAELLMDTIDHLAPEAVEDGAATTLPAGVVLVVVRGMILARMFPVSLTLVPMAINQDLKGLLPKQGLEAEYLASLLRGTADQSLQRLDEAGHGTKALRMDAWASMELPIPPVDEQRQIANFLAQRIEALDELSREARAAIELLRERRTALISAAVTGQIDVRNVVGERVA
jgi:Restriction endonuclease S subunits